MAGCDLNELFDQQRPLIIVEQIGARYQLLRLRLDGLDYGLIRVPEIGNAVSADTIEIPVPLIVPNHGVFASHQNHVSFWIEIKFVVLFQFYESTHDR